ncbi:MAG: helix-turn-helix domain-containing protein [Bdellovibrionaceae bacterium]|nr:helix-turn-helix domain-containing protein [Pseudobdellovibrionaceae bacterium]
MLIGFAPHLPHSCPTFLSVFCKTTRLENKRGSKKTKSIFKQLEFHAYVKCAYTHRKELLCLRKAVKTQNQRESYTPISAAAGWIEHRGAAKASGLKDGIINHLEHGRVRVHPHHLEALLPAYGATRKTYEMFASGKVPLPQDLRKECLEIVQEMSPEQLQTAHPVLQSLSKNN